MVLVEIVTKEIKRMKCHVPGKLRQMIITL